MISSRNENNIFCHGLKCKYRTDNNVCLKHDKKIVGTGICEDYEENKGTYKQFIENLRNKYIGKKVIYNGETYKVVDVDYNGMLLINKKSYFTETTAVKINQVKIKNRG